MRKISEIEDFKSGRSLFAGLVERVDGPRLENSVSQDFLDW